MLSNAAKWIVGAALIVLASIGWAQLPSDADAATMPAPVVQVRYDDLTPASCATFEGTVTITTCVPNWHGDAAVMTFFEDGTAVYADGTVYDANTGQFSAGA